MYARCCFFLTCGVAILPAQQFDLADVHASVGVSSDLRGGFTRGNRYEVRNATMVDLVSAAWGVDAEKVIGGPAWLDTNRFDVTAQCPVNTTPEVRRRMLQALLADRFQLVVHADTRPLPGYVLTVARRPKIGTTAGGESRCRPLPPNTPPNWEVSCTNMTAAQFADRLPRIAGDYFEGNTITDLTGLNGSWDYRIKWSARNSLATAGADGISIFDAVEKQLGLKIEVRNITTPVIVVDRVNAAPSPDPPGVAQRLAAMPMEFELAAIKTSLPGSTERKLKIEPAGRVELSAFTLRELVKFAWELQDMDVLDNDEMLVGAPKWMESERFDIVATSAPPIDIDSLHAMLRKLLEDRFKLAVHYEERTVPAYALVAVKAKLKRADPSNRTGCRNALTVMVNASTPLFAVVCRNMTMAQLAGRLQGLGGSYVPHPVVDSTGFTGAWDFVLRWSPPHLVPASGEDPNSAFTVVEALDKQLGLRLKLGKHPMPVVVIDRVERQPSEN